MPAADLPYGAVIFADALRLYAMSYFAAPKITPTRRHACRAARYAFASLLYADFHVAFSLCRCLCAGM